MNIGWIGCGAMGFPMAKTLINAGYNLKIYNRNSNRVKPLSILGAKIVEAPKDVVIDSDIVISVTSDDEASKQVWEGKNGVMSVLPKDRQTIMIESSTVSLERCINLQEKLYHHSDRIDFLTAPILGTPLDAEKGELIFLIGGSKECLNKMKAWLETLAKDIIYVGSQQQAMALKLSITASLSIQLLLQNELLNFLEKCGLSSKMCDFFNNLPFTGYIAKILDSHIKFNNPDLFSIDLVKKDLLYLVKSQKIKGLTPKLSDTAHEIYSTIFLKKS